MGDPLLKKFPQFLYAWMGEDELGSGAVGIKIGQVPAGNIPLASIHFEKLERLKPQIEAQAGEYGKKIYLVLFRIEAIVDFTSAGKPL